METICKNIANRIGTELNFDNDKKEVIAYGTFAFLQILLNLILVIIFGYLYHVLIGALIISLIIAILRKYSGGAHASSPSTCTIVGTIICVVLAIIANTIASYINSWRYVLLLGAIVFIWSYYFIFKLSPVDSVTKPIKRQEKRNSMKKYSILILSVYAITVIVNVMRYRDVGGKLFVVYSLCIYMGILWQVFTLTRKGHVILGKIDTIANYILDIGRRREKNEKIKY